MLSDVFTNSQNYIEILIGSGNQCRVREERAEQKFPASLFTLKVRIFVTQPFNFHFHSIHKILKILNPSIIKHQPLQVCSITNHLLDHLQKQWTQLYSGN